MSQIEGSNELSGKNLFDQKYCLFFERHEINFLWYFTTLFLARTAARKNVAIKKNLIDYQ